MELYVWYVGGSSRSELLFLVKGKKEFLEEDIFTEVFKRHEIEQLAYSQQKCILAAAFC